VDGLYPLREYLGTDETGAVYATEFEGQKAAIKIVPASGRNADELIWRWRLASKVSHPHLIRLQKVGRAQLEGAAVAYVVMECAEENLSQVLAGRPLTSEEVKEMLGPALDAIACIHREGFVHGRLSPANITAVNDVLKLSSDSLRRVVESGDLPPLQGPYRPPEVAAGGTLSPAADIWALGVTLVETLTQRRPSWSGAEKELVIPDGAGEPFLDIIRRCLRPYPNQRCTAAEIIELLGTRSAAPKKSRAWWYALPLVIVVIAVLALWLGQSSPKVTIPDTGTAPVSSSPSPVPAHPAATRAEKPAPAKAAPVVAQKTPEPAAPDPEPEPTAAARTVPTSPEVVTQVMPEVLDKARRSIQGKVSVAVKVHADAYGTVKEAALEPAHVSRYFSGVALKAVRRWKFRPVKNGEVFVPQDWIVRFEFTRDDTKVQVEHAAP